MQLSHRMTSDNAPNSPPFQHAVELWANVRELLHNAVTQCRLIPVVYLKPQNYPTSRISFVKALTAIINLPNSWPHFLLYLQCIRYGTRWTVPPKSICFLPFVVNRLAGRLPQLLHQRRLSLTTWSHLRGSSAETWYSDGLRWLLYTGDT